MKFLGFTLFLISTISFAHASAIKPGTELLNYTCTTEGAANFKYSIKITANANALDEENVQIPATLTIARIVPIGSEVMVVPQVFIGKYKYEDVVNEFISSSRQTKFTLYADELDQTMLETLNNGKLIRTLYNCN